MIDITSVPAPDYNVIATAMETLPIRPMLAVGDTIDEIKLVRVLAQRKIGRLFLATDNGRWAVLKFPDPASVNELERTQFMREVFLGQHIAHPNVGASLLLPEGRQSRLYVAMPYYKGETLEDRLRRDGPMKVEDADPYCDQSRSGPYGASQGGRDASRYQAAKHHAARQRRGEADRLWRRAPAAY